MLVQKGSYANRHVQAMIGAPVWHCSKFYFIPSGKQLHNYGKSQFLVGKPTIKITFFNGKSPSSIGKSTISMAMASIAFCMFTRGYRSLHPVGGSQDSTSRNHEILAGLLQYFFSGVALND